MRHTSVIPPPTLRHTPARQRSAPSTALDRHVEALPARRVDECARLLPGPYGERRVDAGLTNVQVEALPQVLHLDQVGTPVGEHRQQLRQRAGPVTDPGEDRQAPPRLVLAPPDQPGHET